MKVCVFAPVPPPFHGANYATKLFLESEISKKFSIFHINTQYVQSLENIGKPEISKLFSFFKYLIKVFSLHKSVDLNYLIFIPSFHSWSFLRDSVTIFIINYFTPVKVILWCHTNDFLTIYKRSHYLMRLYRKFIVSKAYRIVSVGNNLKKNYDFFFDIKKIVVIHNGLPLDPYPGKKKETGNIEIIFLSNMLKSKGWVNLFTAAKTICKKYDNVTFKFYGQPSFDSSHEYINAEFSGSGYCDRILYKGSVNGELKKEALVTADIFCLPSYSEAFPFSILEAMMYGLPVVATDTGSINEAIIDHQGGYLLKSNEPEDIIVAINNFIKEPQKIQEMGKFNQKRFLENFEIKIFEKKWCEFLSKLNN